MFAELEIHNALFFEELENFTGNKSAVGSGQLNLILQGSFQVSGQSYPFLFSTFSFCHIIEGGEQAWFVIEGEFVDVDFQPERFACFCFALHLVVADISLRFQQGKNVLLVFQVSIKLCNFTLHCRISGKMNQFAGWPIGIQDGTICDAADNDRDGDGLGNQAKAFFTFTQGCFNLCIQFFFQVIGVLGGHFEQDFKIRFFVAQLFHFYAQLSKLFAQGSYFCLQ